MYRNIIAIVVTFTFIGFTSAQEWCVQCNSLNDKNCLLSPSEMAAQPCGIPSNASCFTRIENGHVQRGCAGELSESARNNCTGAPNTCETCVQISTNIGVPCNNYLYPVHRIRCHQCTGDLNTNCGAEIYSNALVCPTYVENDSCFVRRQNRTVTRGCISSMAECAPANRCFVCQGNGCNSISGNSTDVPEYNHATNLNSNNVGVAFLSLLSLMILKNLF